MTKALLLTALVLMPLPALAGPREDALAGISRCSALSDDRQFLNCLYGAAQPLRASLGLSPAPASQTRLVPPVAGTPRAAGLAPQPKPVGGLANALGSDPTANWMETFSFDRSGLFTVTFSNGQVWRQDASDTARAHWSGRASDYSIRLSVDGGGRSGVLMVRGDAAPYQVHRLR